MVIPGQDMPVVARDRPLRGAQHARIVENA